MAWNPSPKVADCREIARKWGVQQVIIIALDVPKNTIEYASFGETKALCDRTQKLAEAAYEAVLDNY